MPDKAGPMAQQMIEAITRFQLQRTGHAPADVTIVLSKNTLFATLHEALTPAEIVLSQTAAGAAHVQEYHRTLFDNSVADLQEEIRQIAGVAVREAAVEIESNAGAVMHAFTSGAMVQIFQLAAPISAEAWNGDGT